jgi:hypothetical protein
MFLFIGLSISKSQFGSIESNIRDHSGGEKCLYQTESQSQPNICTKSTECC